MQRIILILALLSASACTQASFAIAEPLAEEDADDATNDADAPIFGEMDATSSAFDSATTETPPAETRTADSAPFVEDVGSKTPEVGPDIAFDSTLEASCALYDHHDACTGQSWRDCVPSGTPGKASTYSIALLDDVLSRAESYYPGAHWGSRESCACGASSCVDVVMTTAAGLTAHETWCYAGPLAGLYVGTGAGAPSCICPSAEAGGAWW